MKEVLRYLGIKNENISFELEEKIRFIQNELIKKCRPKSVFLEIDNIDVFNSRSLSSHLSDCSRFFLFAATLGPEADMIIRKYSAIDISNAAIAQAVATKYIEEYCDNAMANFDKGKMFFKTRFSPGYGDFNIEHQKYILDSLDASKRIGITLTDGLMMVPEKSVTAVLGLSDKEECSINKCADCKNSDCEYRER